MKSFLSFLLPFCSISGSLTSTTNSTSNHGQNWAVLVSTSFGYTTSYAEEASLCHAYHDLIAHGIPPSNIITMLFDDAAHDTRNPHPGTLINQPNGSNLYPGVVKDYTGNDVQAEVFTGILLADPQLKARGKKVLESGPNDNVFIYLIADAYTRRMYFPDDDLYASSLISTLELMHERKMYNKLLFYLDADRSGSMFDGLLPDNISILAITSTSPLQRNCFCFCNVFTYTCLGTQFGVNWLLDSDVGKDFGTKTVKQQFLKVKSETGNSTVQEYGDLSIGEMLLSAFQGSVDPPPKSNPYQKCVAEKCGYYEPLHLMERRIARASPEDRSELRKKLDLLYQGREFLDQSVRNVLKYLCDLGYCHFSEKIFDQKVSSICHQECAEKLIRSFSSYCFKPSKHPYAIKYLDALVNIAEGSSFGNLGNECSQISFKLERACREMIPHHSFKRIE